MPGFNICGTGEGPSSTAEVRRKHRWVFRTLEQISVPALLVLKTASRPKFAFEQPEMHHDQEVVYFAGKQTWDPIEMVWYDVEQDPDVSQELYEWLNRVNEIAQVLVEPPASYKKLATLEMTDGKGAATESWQLCNVWPAELDWGDLDYTNTELAEITATMRFDRASKES